ncbi:MAG: ThuA domain-containing protein [Kiritimatiellia bacterium]|nr:ThuA domain-containing protein [Kiritimatiellia bacterium]
MMQPRRRNLTMVIGLLLVLGQLTSYAQDKKPRVNDDTAKKIAAAVPKKARVKPSKRHKILVLSYQSHNAGRFAGEKAMELMAENTGAFELTFVYDAKKLPEVMVPEYLKQFDAVCHNNSTGGGGKAANGKELADNLDEYVSNGGGLFGFHAATDNRAGKVFGGFFTGHPWSMNVGIKLDDPEHPLCSVFEGKGFMVNDEIYQFNKGTYTREKLRVLLSLDMNKNPARGKREDKDYAVAWVKQHGKGRIFYSSLGHRAEIWWNPTLMQFYLDGIQFALGDLDGDMTPSAKLNPQPAPALVPDQEQ